MNTDSTEVIYQSEVHICDSVEIDTCILINQNNDTTTLVHEIIHDRELKIIEKLIEKEDFGKNVVSIMVVLFIGYAVISRWMKDRKNKK